MDLNYTAENPVEVNSNAFYIDIYATAPEQIHIKPVSHNDNFSLYK